jgi:hypothetical protein
MLLPCLNVLLGALLREAAIYRCYHLCILLYTYPSGRVGVMLQCYYYHHRTWIVNVV